MISELVDNGGRRLGFERRQFSYNEHIPERRLGGGRRSDQDRRSGESSRHKKERRAVFLIDSEFAD
jgi:hypothetical protein